MQINNIIITESSLRTVFTHFSDDYDFRAWRLTCNPDTKYENMVSYRIRNRNQTNKNNNMAIGINGMKKPHKKQKPNERKNENRRKVV